MTAPVLSAAERKARRLVILNLRGCGYEGAGFDGITRQAFREQAEQAFLRAEKACRGELTNDEGRRRAIDPRGLFTGTESHARRWASEELVEWWEHVEARATYDEYAQDLIRSAVEELDAAGELDDDADEETAVSTTTEASPEHAAVLEAQGPAERLPRGAMALNDARAFYRRHFHFPSTVQLDVFTLWTAGLTHMRDHNQRYIGPTAVRMYIRASTPGAGKSLLGDFIALTGGRGEVVFAPASTYWGVVEMIAEQNKTVVLDNYDEAKGNARSGQLNIALAGAYSHTALLRSGRNNEEEACVYGPMAITAIGDRLRRRTDFRPVEERSVVVDVAKKPREVKLPRFDRRDPEHRSRCESIRRACEAWGRDVAPEVAVYRPTDLPDELDSRDLDMWEPMVAIADMAGGEWPARIRRALSVLVLGERVADDEDDDPFARLTPAERSMVEVSHVLDDLDGDTITTVELLEAMAQLPGGGRWAVPQGTERDRLLRARTMALSADLAVFGVNRSSIKVPVGGGQYRNGWYASDVLPCRPADLPDYRAADLDAHARRQEEEEVPFE